MDWVKERSFDPFTPGYIIHPTLGNLLLPAALEAK